MHQDSQPTLHCRIFTIRLRDAYVDEDETVFNHFLLMHRQPHRVDTGAMTSSGRFYGVGVTLGQGRLGK